MAKTPRKLADTVVVTTDGSTHRLKDIAHWQHDTVEGSYEFIDDDGDVRAEFRAASVVYVAAEDFLA